LELVREVGDRQGSETAARRMRRERSKEERERKNHTTEQMLPAVTECPGLGPMLGDTVLQVTGRERALARMRVKKRKSQAALLMSTFGLVLAKAGAKNRLRRLMERFKGNWKGEGRESTTEVALQCGDRIRATLLRLNYRGMVSVAIHY
jgi:hypothetical protein